MVSILPSERTAADVAGRLVGDALAKNLPSGIEKGYDRGLIKQGLDKVRSIANNPQAKPLDIIFALQEASAGIPGSERYFAPVLDQILKITNANRSVNVPRPGEDQNFTVPERQQLPSFGNQAQPASEKTSPEFFPNNIPSQEAPGTEPQAVTLGKKYKLFTPDQRIQEARRISQSDQALGGTMTLDQALKSVDDYIAYSDAYNAKVEKDILDKQESQRNYGDLAETEIKKVFSKTKTDEKGKPVTSLDPLLDSNIISWFRKKGEEISQVGKSEAERKRYLANEAANFKNSIVNVQKDLSAPRLQNAVQRWFNNEYKSFEKSAQDLRTTLKPLLDNGFYDLARNLLEQKGYGLEERDYILNPLNIQAESIISALPKPSIQRGGGDIFASESKVSNINPEELKSAILKIKDANPNFSLPLVRKALDDKAVDWRQYKDAVNELVASGELELTADQRNQIGYLDKPPLGLLDTILQGLNIIGR